MLYFVRHGERGDYAGEEERALVELNFDSHLTKLGCKQAFETGQYLATKLANKTVVMVVSPFLRTIMTAHQLSLSLPSIHENTFFLHEEVGEYLKPDDFDRYIYDDIYIKTKGENAIREKYANLNDPKAIQLKNKLFEGENTFISVFPETEEHLHEKVKVFTSELVSYFKANFNPETHVLLVVTHQASIRAFRENVLGTTEGIEIGYCGLVGGKIEENGNISLDMKGENSHVVSF